jgi:hypothetical protein
MRLRSLATARWAYRAWYYFRLGYSTYLTFILGYVSTLITVYYLAIKNIPDLLNIFPHFVPFAILATLIGGPGAILIGWTHLKRRKLFSTETEVALESNPFVYKLQPGWVKEVQIPAMLVELKLLRRLADSPNPLTDSEKAEIDELEKKFHTLLQGGYVGAPRRKWSS